MNTLAEFHDKEKFKAALAHDDHGINILFPVNNRKEFMVFANAKEDTDGNTEIYATFKCVGKDYDYLLGVDDERIRKYLQKNLNVGIPKDTYFNWDGQEDVAILRINIAA